MTAPVEHALFWGRFADPDARADLERERFKELSPHEWTAVEYARQERARQEETDA